MLRMNCHLFNWAEVGKDDLVLRLGSKLLWHLSSLVVFHVKFDTRGQVHVFLSEDKC